MSSSARAGLARSARVTAAVAIKEGFKDMGNDEKILGKYSRSGESQPTRLRGIPPPPRRVPGWWEAIRAPSSRPRVHRKRAPGREFSDRMHARRSGRVARR